uniref:Uncharacterized protein n=1 Tax=Leersia perrieri TaxID=77586 RepID=A0A0D9XK80_9ORYZ
MQCRRRLGATAQPRSPPPCAPCFGLRPVDPSLAGAACGAASRRARRAVTRRTHARAGVGNSG